MPPGSVLCDAEKFALTQHSIFKCANIYFTYATPEGFMREESNSAQREQAKMSTVKRQNIEILDSNIDFNSPGSSPNLL